MLKRILSTAASWAMALGITGFLLGFVGPILFMPEANQGPLLGIFITGPLGVIIGAIAGAIVAWRREPRLRP